MVVLVSLTLLACSTPDQVYELDDPCLRASLTASLAASEVFGDPGCAHGARLAFDSTTGEATAELGSACRVDPASKADWERVVAARLQRDVAYRCVVQSGGRQAKN